MIVAGAGCCMQDMGTFREQLVCISAGKYCCMMKKHRNLSNKHAFRAGLF